jgi:hypothetical protein
MFGGAENCPSGQILRRGSRRRSYRRKSYTRKDGTKVRGSNIGPSRMSSTCIKDIGKPGHGPYILPKLDPDVSLSRQGYHLSQSAPERHKALKRASKKYSTLGVLKRVNLIGNYSKANKSNYKKLRDDVEFMKRQYAKEKKSKK